MSSWNVILDAGKPVVLDKHDTEFPRYTHIFYRYGVYPTNGGFLAYANERSQRAALKRYPGAELKLLVTCANENYERERFKPDLNGVEFEKRRITPALSRLIVERLDEGQALTYAAFESMRLPLRIRYKENIMSFSSKQLEDLLDRRVQWAGSSRSFDEYIIGRSRTLRVRVRGDRITDVMDHLLTVEQIKAETGA